MRFNFKAQIRKASKCPSIDFISRHASSTTKCQARSRSRIADHRRAEDGKMFWDIEGIWEEGYRILVEGWNGVPSARETFTERVNDMEPVVLVWSGKEATCVGRGRELIRKRGDASEIVDHSDGVLPDAMTNTTHIILLGWCIL
jgi:hypothetical protein